MLLGELFLTMFICLLICWGIINLTLLYLEANSSLPPLRSKKRRQKRRVEVLKDIARLEHELNTLWHRLNEDECIHCRMEKRPAAHTISYPKNRYYVPTAGYVDHNEPKPTYVLGSTDEYLDNQRVRAEKRAWLEYKARMREQEIEVRRLCDPVPQRIQEKQWGIPL